MYVEHMLIWNVFSTWKTLSFETTKSTSFDVDFDILSTKIACLICASILSECDVDFDIRLLNLKIEKKKSTNRTQKKLMLHCLDNDSTLY